jgi:uncharacterized protein YggE
MFRSQLTRTLGLTLAAAAVLVATVAALPAVAQDTVQTPVPQPVMPEQFPENTITVSGIGTASGEPDVAYIELGVETMNADLATAYAEAAETMQQVNRALIDLGVDAADIRTSSVNIYPQEQYNPETGAPGERTYRVSNTLRVTVREVTMVEQVIGTAVGAGANSIYNFNFAIEDVNALEQQAREVAVANARERADQLAAALGVSVGRPVVISEAYGGGTQPPLPYGRGGGGVAMDAATSFPIQPGQLDVTVQILVTFAIGE